MARERSPNRDKSKEIYLSANGDIKLTDIAAQLSVSDSQIRKWKSSDKWDLELKGALPMSKSNVTNRKNTKVKKKEPIAKEVKEVIESDGLNDKQRLFCIYYAKTFNATRSYQRAYGCEYNVALVNGPRLLGKARIEEEIRNLKSQRLNLAFMTSDDVLQKFIEIAFSDDSIFDGIEMKMTDKLKALDFLAKYNGLLSADVKERLEIEREKLAIIKRKDAPDEEDVEDDGFIAALSAQVESVWDDE